jgi:hypothetical protein
MERFGLPSMSLSVTQKVLGVEASNTRDRRICFQSPKGCSEKKKCLLSLATVNKDYRIINAALNRNLKWGSLRFFLLHGDQMNGNIDPQGFLKHGSVERQLMGVPVAPRVGFDPGQVIAGFQVHEARGRIEPINTDLARESAVLCPHDRFSDSALQQINGRLVHRDRFIHPLDRFEL